MRSFLYVYSISIENLFSISFSMSFTNINHFSISLSFSYWNISSLHTQDTAADICYFTSHHVINLSSSERSFSALMFIKNYIWFTMADQRLNGLALLFVYLDIMLDYDELACNSDVNVGCVDRLCRRARVVGGVQSSTRSEGSSTSC